MRAFCIATAVGISAPGCGKVVKIDYDAAMECEAVPMTALPGPAAAVWLGDSYAAVWHETREDDTDLFFGRLDAAGALTGSSRRLTDDPGASRVFSLVATGGGYAVLFEDDRDAAEIHHLYVAELDADGAPVAGEIQIGALWGTDVATGDKSSSVLVWNGTELATAWIEDRDDTTDPEVLFARWLPGGTAVGEPVRINTAAAAARDVALVATDDGWALAWSDTRDAAGDGNSEIYAVRLDADAERITPEDVRVTEDPAFSVRPTLVASGSELGLAWVDNRTGDSELYFTRLDANGQVGDVLRVTEDPSPVETKETPALLHDADGYALVWADRREQEGAPNNEAYLARIDDASGPIGEGDVRLTTTAADSRPTDVLRSGETWTVLGEEVISADEREGWITTVCPE